MGFICMCVVGVDYAMVMSSFANQLAILLHVIPMW